MASENGNGNGRKKKKQPEPPEVPAIPATKPIGRPPNWFRQACRNAVHDNRLIERLVSVATGKIGEIVETKEGMTFCMTPIKEQRLAIEALLRFGVVEDEEKLSGIALLIHRLQYMPQDQLERLATLPLDRLAPELIRLLPAADAEFTDNPVPM